MNWKAHVHVVTHSLHQTAKHAGNDLERGYYSSHDLKDLACWSINDQMHEKSQVFLQNYALH